MEKSSISESIRVTDGEIAKIVLMPGDPLRAKYVAERYLENPKCFNTVRNMFGYTGTYKGKKISVMGSGMGSPSMALYATELFDQFDVDAIIRIGSAGGLLPEIKMRDVVVAMSASTNSGLLKGYDFYGSLAPTANYEMLAHAVESAREKGASYAVGPVYSSDFFYHPMDDSAEKARDMGHLAVEMEVAGLYLTAAHYHKKALALLTISDHLFTGEKMTALERQESFHEMMEIALDTAWKTIA